jgi:hypothetical protein
LLEHRDVWLQRRLGGGEFAVGQIRLPGEQTRDRPGVAENRR